MSFMPSGHASESLGAASALAGAASRFGVVSAARVGCVGCAGSGLRCVVIGSRSIEACVRAGAVHALTTNKTPEIAANRVGPKGSACAYISQTQLRAAHASAQRARNERGTSASETRDARRDTNEAAARVLEKRAPRAVDQDAQASFGYTFL